MAISASVLVSLLTVDLSHEMLLLTGFALVLHVFLIGGWQVLRLSLPQLDGEVVVEGLESNVSIERDTNGVVHISAHSNADAAFALGYAHAQDRLWQMDFTRRLAAGRLSEILGEQSLLIDRTMRKLGFQRHARSSLQALPKDLQENLSAYAAGVNAHINKRKRWQLSPEFMFLRYQPEPWQPTDCLLWPKLMALQLSGSGRKQLSRLRLFNQLPASVFEALFPECTIDREIIAALGPDGKTALEEVLQNLAPPLGPSRASNIWVVGSTRSETGKPILANDPHLGLQTPIAWYLVRQTVAGNERVGASIPGLPSLVVGHNGNLAWGVSSTGSDVQDIFVETLDPEDPSRYSSAGKSADFHVREETIAVRNAAPVLLSVHETVHGPVLSDMKDSKDRRRVVSLAHSTASESDTTLSAYHKIAHASSVKEAIESLRDFVAPPLNFHFSDKQGRIGFVAAGHVPVRKGGDASLPVPGDCGRYDWAGNVEFEALPRSIDPPSAVLWNANNSIAIDGYPYMLTRFWAHPARAMRIEDLLEAPRIGVDRSVAMQGDILSPARDLMLPLLKNLSPETVAGRHARVRLLEWDGRMARAQTEPILFYKWIRKIGRNFFEHLGPACPDITVENLFTFLQTFKGEFEGKRIPDVARAALDEVAGELVRQHGKTLKSLRWGDHHRASLEHVFWKKIPLLGRLFDLSLPTDGDAFTLNAGGMPLLSNIQPFRHMHGAAFRAVFDLSDTQLSLFAVATGPCGHPLSRYYGNLTEKWQRMEMITISSKSIIRHKLHLIRKI